MSLKRAVRSVQRQSQTVDALVVLDRPEKAQSVEKLLAGLRHTLVTTPGGVGAAAARNIGVRHAETTHVAFLDDDGEWVADKSELQLAGIQDGMVVGSRSLLVGSSSRVVPEQLYRTDGEAGRRVIDYILDRSTVRLCRNFIQTSTLLCARDTALEVTWNEDLSCHQDWDWVTRLESAGVRLSMLPDVLVRVHQESLDSISRSADWRASSRWIESVGSEMSDQSRADFLTSVVARSAFAAGSWNEGARHLVAGLRSRPHAAAVLVGLLGVLETRRGGAF